MNRAPRRNSRSFVFKGKSSNAKGFGSVKNVGVADTLTISGPLYFLKNDGFVSQLYSTGFWLLMLFPTYFLEPHYAIHLHGPDPRRASAGCRAQLYRTVTSYQECFNDEKALGTFRS